MNYEFHVGDYVETKTGTIGFVSIVPKTGLCHWTVTKLSEADARDDLYDVNEAYCIVLPLFKENRFARIGQYDFTKKDEGKIEPLSKEYTKPFPLYNTIKDTASSAWSSIDFGAVGKKINELIEAVNELRDKND